MKKEHKILLICTVLVLTLLSIFMINHLKDDDPLKIYDVKDIPNLDVRDPCHGTGVVVEFPDNSYINDSYLSIAERFDDGWMLLELESEEGFTGFSKVKEGDVVYYEAKGPVRENCPGTTLNVYRLDILGEVKSEVLKEIKEVFNQMYFNELR